MSYYIIKGHSGRLAVVDYPPGMDVYVKGPGPMDSCFEVMEEMNKNKLDSKDNNILINFLFKGKLQC